MSELKPHYLARLRILADGPRGYGLTDTTCEILMRRGLVRETNQPLQMRPYSRPPHRSYEITEAGRAVLSEHAAGEIYP
jgi:hypothetical protein